MNDRYLYRAKRCDTGEWVIGFYHWTNWRNPQTKEIVEVTHSILPIDYQDSYHVDPSTICQCTGLKDKNGKLIWENDIVTGWFDDKIINGYIMYGSNAIFFIERKGLHGIHLDNSEDWLEVIGNIFDEGSENIGKGAEEN